MVDPIAASGGVIQTALNFYFIWVYFQKYPNFEDIERPGPSAPLATLGADSDIPPPPPPKVVSTTANDGAVYDAGLRSAEEGATLGMVVARQSEERERGASAPVAKDVFVLEEDE